MSTFIFIIALIVIGFSVFVVIPNLVVHQRNQRRRRDLENQIRRDRIRDRQRQELFEVNREERINVLPPPHDVVIVPGPSHSLTPEQKKYAAELVQKKIKLKEAQRQAVANQIVKRLVKRRELLGVDFKPEIPYRTIYVGTYNKNLIEVREYEPMERTIFIVKNEGSKVKQYSIQLPYCIFMWRHSGERHYLYLGFAEKPLKSLKDKIYFPPLPNVHKSYSVCVPVGANLTDTIDNFWSSVFVISEIPTGPDFLSNLTNKDFNDAMKEWDKMSLEQVNQKLLKSSVTIKDFVNSRNFKEIEQVQNG